MPKKYKRPKTRTKMSNPLIATERTILKKRISDKIAKGQIDAVTKQPKGKKGRTPEWFVNIDGVVFGEKDAFAELHEVRTGINLIDAEMMCTFHKNYAEQFWKDSGVTTFKVPKYPR
jgi:hypothetical protein